MVAELVDGLVDRGHHVTLVGAGPTGTKAQRYHAVFPEPPSARLGEPMPEVVHAAAAVEPQLGPGVEYVGEADASTRRELYAGAAALLLPVRWEEPSGLVMVEATACGTPVVALRRGSVPEVVVHGETGMVVDDPRDLASAVRSVEELDRRRCRAHVVRHFDTVRMVADYEATYRTLADGRDLRLGARPDDPTLVRA